MIKTIRDTIIAAGIAGLSGIAIMGVPKPDSKVNTEMPNYIILPENSRFGLFDVMTGSMDKVFGEDNSIGQLSAQCQESLFNSAPLKVPMDCYLQEKYIVGSKS